MKSVTEILAAVYSPSFWRVIDEWGDYCIFCGASDGSEQFERGEIHHYDRCLLREIRVHLMAQACFTRRTLRSADAYARSLGLLNDEPSPTKPRLEWHQDSGWGSWVHCLDCGAEMSWEQVKKSGHQCEPLPIDPPYPDYGSGGLSPTAAEYEAMAAANEPGGPPPGALSKPDPELTAAAEVVPEDERCANVSCTICYPHGVTINQATPEPSPTDPIYLGNNASGSTVVLPPDRPSLAKEIERIVDEVFAPEPKVPEDAHDDDEPLKCSNVGCTICYPRGLVEPEPEPALPSLCKICLLVSACPRVTVDDITTVQQPVQTCEHYTATSRDAPTEVVPEHVVYRTARAEPEVVPVVQPERLHSWQSMKSGKAVRCTNCGLVAFGGVELQPGQGRSTCSLPVGASIGVCPGSLSPVPADPSPVKTVQPAVPLVQVICPRCHVTEVVPAAGGVLPDLPQITLMSGPFMVVSWAHPAFGRQTGVYCRACWVSTEASIIASILPPAVTCQPIQTGDPRQSA